MKRPLLWLLPIGLVAVLVAVILALPMYVASATHRASIEALASSLTGQQVRIAGKLSLALFPDPQLIAGRITLSAPDQETITARSLTMAIAPAALLRGQLSVRSLTLDEPVIAFPWPLPGGASAIAPPPWLAALHAQIHRGTISLGALRFTEVEADVFTGSQGAVTVSGTGKIFGKEANLSMALGGAQLGSPAPLSITGISGPLSGHFAGTLSGDSALTGQIIISAPVFSLSANVNASGKLIAFNGLQAKAAGGEVTGNGSLSLSAEALNLDLNSNHLDLSNAPEWLSYRGVIPISVDLHAASSTFEGTQIPALHAAFDVGGSGAAIHELQASLPGDSELSATLKIGVRGAVAGAVCLSTREVAVLLSNYGLAAPAGLPAVDLGAAIAGSTRQLEVTSLRGSIGDDDLSGQFVISGQSAYGALHLSRIDLLPALSWLRQVLGTHIAADGEVTADHATLGAVSLDHLVIDADLDAGLNLRRVSAHLDQGIIAGSMTLDAAGHISAARGFLALPSAAQLAKLLPTDWAPPAAVLHPRLSLNLSAIKSGDAVGVSTVATLGAFTITAAPLINMTASSASGAISLQHPNAIVALSLFGLNRGLAFPGAGSLSMRAGFQISPAQFGIPNFVLSFGRTVASGQLSSRHGVITGNIAAETIDIPAFSKKLHVPWSTQASVRGYLRISAQKLLIAGTPVLNDILADLTLTPRKLAIIMPQATLAGGKITGKVVATLSSDVPPSLSADFTAGKVNAAALNWPWPLPYSVQSGSLSLAGSLTATGYTPKIWLATLTGRIDLQASEGTLRGFSLDGLAAALQSRDRRKGLEAATSGGTTKFDQLQISGTFNHGNCSIEKASLAGTSGTSSASGSIDLFDRTLALHLTLNPRAKPALSLNTTVLGSFESPKTFTPLKSALAWRATQQ